MSSSPFNPDSDALLQEVLESARTLVAQRARRQKRAAKISLFLIIVLGALGTAVAWYLAGAADASRALMITIGALIVWCGALTASSWWWRTPNLTALCMPLGGSLMGATAMFWILGR